MAAIIDAATKYLAYSFLVVLMLILDLIILHMDTKTTFLGHLVHILWLFLFFSDKMAAILDLAIKYLTYRFFCCLCVNPRVNRPVFGHQITILGQLVIISWLFFQFSKKWRPSWILAGWQP